MNLFLITKQYKEVINAAIDSETGEINIDALSEIAGFSDSFDEKVQNIASYIEDLKSKLLIVKEYVRLLNERGESIDKKIESLSAYVMKSMDEVGATKVSTALFTVVNKLNPPYVDVLCESNIPDDYMITKTTVSPDKRKILEELKSGHEISGVQMKRTKRLDININHL